MKTLLIDAHNIISGGGATLLDYLIGVLESQHRNYFIIKNSQTIINGEENKQINCPNLWARKRILNESFHKVNPDTILCFGNYPPQNKYPVKTITYFHNSYLIKKWYKAILDDKLVFFRQKYLSATIKNTNYFVFQNERIKDEFIKLYGYSEDLFYLIIPFFDENKIWVQQKKIIEKKDQFIYTSLPHPHKNHKYLLKVWKELQKKNYNPTLLLTIPELPGNKQLLLDIDEINRKGGRIVNLGIIPYDDILRHTAESKFCIYPSLLETMGLGLVESALLDCRVLAADLSYTEGVVEPSLYFDPYSIHSCMDSVVYAIQYESRLKKSVPKIKDRIEELIEIL